MSLAIVPGPRFFMAVLWMQHYRGITTHSFD